MALSSTQLDASANVPGTFSYAPAAGAVLGAGATTLTATFTPSDTHDFVSGSQIQTILTVVKATPVLSWQTPASINTNTPLSTAQLDATSTVAGTFTYVPPAGTYLTAGNQTLTAMFTPSDTIDYVSGGTAQTTVTVNALTQIFANSFDGQATGALVLGSTANVFSSDTNKARLAVESSMATSAPNGLSIGLTGSAAYATKQYPTGYARHVLQFSVKLASTFHLASGTWVELATTSTGNAAGRAFIRMNASGLIEVDYTDNAGSRHALASSFTLTPGAWHTLRLTESTGSGTASFALLADGTPVTSANSLNTGGQKTTSFSVGETANSGTPAGTIYLDDISTSTY